MPDKRATGSVRWRLWAVTVILLGAGSPLLGTPPLLEGPDVPGPSDSSTPGGVDPVAPPPPYVTVVNNGPSSNRVDLVFLGDGYTASQIDTTYAGHVSAMVDYMFLETQEPFARYSRFYNVHRVNVVSNESGADVPPLGIYRDTALDASYYYDGVTDRLLYINTAKGNAALSAGLAGAGFSAEIRLVTVNDTRYGGGGGSYAVYAGGNGVAQEIALHEMGHSYGGLADEYAYDGWTYSGGEPSAPNVTKSPTGDKWDRWLGYTDPAHPEMGAVGAFEGAAYYTYGLYRPSENSKMRSLNRAFDAVGREQLILSMYAFARPLDDWLDNLAGLVDPASLWIDTVDPTVIKVDWYVDDLPIAVDAGETFSLQAYGFGPGTYDVRSHAYDGTGWVRIDTPLTWQDVQWTVTLTPEPSTLAILGLGGAVTALLRRRS